MVSPTTIKIEPVEEDDIFILKEVKSNSTGLASDDDDFSIHRRLRFISLSSMSSSSSDDSDDEEISYENKNCLSDDDSHQKSRYDPKVYLKPFEMLHISVKEEEVKPIGYVKHIVNKQVIVQSYPGLPPIDLDCVLFLDHGKSTLGQIYELFGKVEDPCYIVRFNNVEEIKERHIEQNMKVFFAPNTSHTKFVNVSDLKCQKGSDASWLEDREPPESALDYSDDEEERKAVSRIRTRAPIKYSFWQDY